MSTQRVATLTFPPLVLAVLGTIGSVSAMDDSTIHRAGFRIDPLETCGSCPLGFDPAGFEARLRIASDTSRWLAFDDSSRNLVSLRLDSTFGPCGFELSFSDSIGRVAVGDSLREHDALGSPGELERLFGILADSVHRARTGAVDVVTNPSNAQVWLDGREVGATPLRVEDLRPGRAVVRISSPGWAEIQETLSVEASRIAVIERELVRSKAWIDSVHRDSLWRDAMEHPSKDLPELFDRLAIPVATDPWVSVVVLPFDAQGGSGKDDAGINVAEYGISRWKSDPRFVVLRREVVRRHVRSGAFARAGSLPDSAIVAMGDLVGSRYVVAGSVVELGGVVEYRARMVSVRSGRIVSAATTSVATESVNKLFGDALGDRTRIPAVVSRSVVLPGWGQFHAGRPVHGAVAALSVAAAAGFAAWAWNDLSDKDEVLSGYRDRDPSTVVVGEARGNWWRRAEEARAERNDASTLFGVSLAVVGAAWAANIVDATILGRSESRRVKPRYYAVVPSPAIRPDGIALAWGF